MKINWNSFVPVCFGRKNEFTIFEKFCKVLVEFFIFIIIVFSMIWYMIFRFYLEYPISAVFVITTLFFITNIIIMIMLLLFFCDFFYKEITLKLNRIREKIFKSDMVELISANEENALEFIQLNQGMAHMMQKFNTLIRQEKKQSCIDPLTSCYNRRAMTINFDYIVKKSVREDKTFALAILDLDRFKRVNDTYGHNVGDKVLIEFSKIIKENIRKCDFLYRIGGEEFLIIFTDIDDEKIKYIFSRLSKNVPYRLKKAINEIDMEITMSGGVVFSKEYDINKDPKILLDSMLKSADELLYKAKSDGRNRVYF